MIYIAGGGMRTGSVAMFQIMREIVASTLTGYAPVFPVGGEDMHFIDHAKEWSLDPMKIVVKLHLWHPALELAHDHCAAVILVRDIRDVVVSLKHFRDTTFEKAIASPAVMGNVDPLPEWVEKLPSPGLFIRYEDFISNRMITTVEVARFMGISLSDPEAAQIERKWNVRANQKRATEGHNQRHPDYMAERHIYSGRAGRWKHELTDEQISEIQEKVGKEYFDQNNYEWADV